MTINKFNYEAFALDYLEGKLSVELTEEMERFLATHPAIEAELSGMMEVVYLEPDTNIVFENKAALLKEEKVVWLNKKWVKPLMAAASILLLLMTYFSGYQAGVKQGDNTLVVADDKSGENENEPITTSVVTTIEKKDAVVVDKIEALPVVQEMKLEKAIVKFVPNSSVQTKNEKDTRVVVGKEDLEEMIIDKSIDIVAKKTQVAENESIILVFEKEVAANKELIILAPIALIKPNLVSSISDDDNLNNLSNALSLNVPVREMAGTTIPKKRRHIKDFLGRFPVTQLKEALIPTYYKEENAGQ